VSVLLDHLVRPGGVGLENVRLRLSEMYGEASSMHAATNARGNYEVSLLLPGMEADYADLTSDQIEIYEA